MPVQGSDKHNGDKLSSKKVKGSKRKLISFMKVSIKHESYKKLMNLIVFYDNIHDMLEIGELKIISKIKYLQRYSMQMEKNDVVFGADYDYIIAFHILVFYRQIFKKM